MNDFNFGRAALSQGCGLGRKKSGLCVSSLMNFSIPKFLLCGMLSLLGLGLPLASAELPEECEKKLSEKELKGFSGDLDKFYQSLAGFTADFSQESIMLASTESVKSSGKLRFLRPGRMDWQYLTPEKQRFVSDGSSVWFYQPDGDVSRTTLQLVFFSA